MRGGGTAAADEEDDEEDDDFDFELDWNEVMGSGHLERLTRIRDLVSGMQKYDTTRTRLVCFSGAGFTPDLTTAAAEGKVDLISLDDLYDTNG